MVSIFVPLTSSYELAEPTGEDMELRFDYSELKYSDLNLTEDYNFRSSAYWENESCYLISLNNTDEIVLYRVNQSFIDDDFSGDGYKRLYNGSFDNSKVLYTYITNNETILADAGARMIRSGDKGNTWDEVVSDIGFWGVSEDVDNGVLYAGHYYDGYTDISPAKTGIYKSDDDGRNWDLVWDHEDFDYFEENNLTDDHDHVHDVYFDDVNDYLYATLGDGNVSTIIRAKTPVENTSDWTALANEGPSGEYIQMVPIIRHEGYIYMGRDGGALQTKIYRFKDNGSTEHEFLENNETFEEMYVWDDWDNQSRGHHFDVSKYLDSEGDEYLVWGIRAWYDGEDDNGGGEGYQVIQRRSDFYHTRKQTVQQISDYCKQTPPDAYFSDNRIPDEDSNWDNLNNNISYFSNFRWVDVSEDDTGDTTDDDSSSSSTDSKTDDGVSVGLIDLGLVIIFFMVLFSFVYIVTKNGEQNRR